MANKRMISADIVTSDAFIMMSHKAQALFLQCIINADDDGIIDNMRSIMRNLSIKSPTLSEILKNKFILDLGDGIYCVKHWWILNNAIKSDRYKKTKYVEKLDRLVLKENKAYTLKKTPIKTDDNITNLWRHNGTNRETFWSQVGDKVEP